MKIGIVCYPTFGGSGIVATELAHELALRGNEVHLISYSRPVRMYRGDGLYFFHQIPVMIYPLFEYPPYESALVSRLVEIALTQDLDLLHVHYAVPFAGAAYMTKQILLQQHNKHLPYIVTSHGTDITLVGRDKSFAPVVQFGLYNADAITAVSKFLKSEMVKNFKIPQQRIQVIYNFINTTQHNKEYCQKAQYLDQWRRFLAPRNEFLICHISNFRPLKRIDILLKAFKQVIDNGLNARLVLVGDGPERQNMELLARELKLEDKALFLGVQEDIRDILCISDLFVLTSESESFGLVLLEAMAMGCPVVASNTGGIPEVVRDGIEGLLCPVNDTKAFADAIMKILTNPELHQKLVDNAIKRARDFDTSKIVPQYEQLYRKVINASQRELFSPSN
ncbi:MAG: N-acetyl-alpha-D-glucosaminyl L-malate synthase BshA [Chlorobi bacterium]|nr:N-acetyl-alpha-D-glucosaminyl L-malate synthase BshA [Chlorobiota bacterium]